MRRSFRPATGHQRRSKKVRCSFVRFQSATLVEEESESRKMHAYAEYGAMHVQLYKSIARFGRITTTYDYPVKVAERYLMSPSPTLKFDNPKMHRIQRSAPWGRSGETALCGASYSGESLAFEDHPFGVQKSIRPAPVVIRTVSWTRSWSTMTAHECTCVPTRPLS